MLRTPVYVKQYQSAQERFLVPTITKFFATNFPGLFGKLIAEKIAKEVIDIFDKLRPPSESIEVGQVLWNALDKDTRADSPKRRFVPVVLTLVSQEDVQRLAKGVRPSENAGHAIARMMQEAYDQGGILSNRDIALLTLKDTPVTSQIRLAFEKENNVLLPHTGVLHDMGSCITHKKQIVYKVVVEKKDPAIVAAETNHSQRAVDNYVQNYNRVKTAYRNDPDIEYIHFVTRIAKNVVKQYIALYLQFELKK
jgi:hypothetical protein